MSALERANQALLSTLFDATPREPYAASIVRARRARGRASDVRALFTYWDSVHPGSEIGTTRYRWLVTHRHVELPPWAGSPQQWVPWRPADQAAMGGDPFDFESRLSIPAIVTDCGELLAELAGEADGELAERARERLVEAEPVMRREFAKFVMATHAWTDTFALWCLARRPRLFERLQPLSLAIATCYSATAGENGKVVRGTRFPFHQIPLVSASAQLASGLLALGEELPLVSSLVDFVVRERRPSGGWGDAGGPEDVLTTLVALELLLHLDPMLDPSPSVAFLASHQAEDGTWRCYGPEVPWVTAAIADALESAQRPFADRFRWPHARAGSRDHKTQLPPYAWFDLLSRLFTTLPGLAAAETEVAFLDLAGFRAFNNAYGQDAGDAVLAAFATELTHLDAARAIRDGGDEFLVLGAPTRTGLAHDLDSFRRAWPSVFRARFGTEVPVAARILVRKTRGAGLRQTRETLGRAIGALKSGEKPGAEGLLVEI